MRKRKRNSLFTIHISYFFSFSVTVTQVCVCVCVSVQCYATILCIAISTVQIENSIKASTFCDLFAFELFFLSNMLPMLLYQYSFFFFSFLALKIFFSLILLLHFSFFLSHLAVHRSQTKNLFQIKTN